MIKLGYVTYDEFGMEHKAIIGNGEELFAQPRYNVDFLRDKRDKIVDVEYLEDWQAPTHSFHAMRQSEEIAIRYDRGDYEAGMALYDQTHRCCSRPVHFLMA